MSSTVKNADKAVRIYYGDQVMVDRSRLAGIKRAMSRLESDHMYASDRERMADEELYQEGVARGLFSSPMMR
tara:strand:- start:399 stop:614 length:216 start_codon:yes stop_codon:yes gene_type:complete